jgi:hypothetical protein
MAAYFPCSRFFSNQVLGEVPQLGTQRLAVPTLKSSHP